MICSPCRGNNIQATWYGTGVSICKCQRCERILPSLETRDCLSRPLAFPIEAACLCVRTSFLKKSVCARKAKKPGYCIVYAAIIPMMVEDNIANFCSLAFYFGINQSMEASDDTQSEEGIVIYIIVKCFTFCIH